ncbi:phage tail protein [Candidatus Microthrix sp.]|uniref:phage tail protein n=1 Tax=Candidatus Neomicrothrix sp. TaxID=2719034 RepID=UPI001B5480FE|nr:hypothetical protein [Candidatus Microthrix sp.]MBP6136582.1 hypothetical protein [Candidatus Microthrix sp.]MCH9834508.1 hypothetical protein [bacterium]
MAKSITVKILGDAKGLQGTLDEAGKSLGGFGGTATKGLAIAGTAIAGLGVAALAAAPGILSAGTEMEALAAKSATVFEGSLGSVQNWAKENAAAMGLTTSQAVAAGAGIADLLKPMGFTSAAAATMSTDMLNTSAALSAWTGGTKSATEVSEIITKAMLGETDGLKALGISISAADVQARVAANGQGELTGAAREQAEALATQQLIQEKSTDAQKAWNDGSMAGVQASNESKASLATLKETITKALYPAFAAVLPIITSVATWLGENLPTAIAWAKDHIGIVAGAIAVVLVPAFVAWAVAAGTAAVATLTAAAPFIAVGAAIAAVAAGLIYAYTHFEAFRSIVDGVVAWFRDVAWPVMQTVWDGIVAVIQAAIDIITGIVNVFIGIFTGDWQRAWDGIKGIVQGVVDGIQAILSIAWAIITTSASIAWAGIKAAIMLPIDLLTAAIQLVWDGIQLAADTAWGLLSTAASTAWELVKSSIMTPIDALTAAIQLVWDGIKTAAETAWNAVKDTIGPIIDTIVGFVQGLIDIVQGAIDKLAELKNMAIGGASDELISKIKTQTGQSHSGGITSFGASREGLMLLRNNEAVVPLDSPSDANRVLDQAGIGSDPAAFASVVGPMIARAIRQELRAA